MTPQAPWSVMARHWFTRWRDSLIEIKDRPATTHDRPMKRRASARTLEYRGVQVPTRYRNSAVDDYFLVPICRSGSHQREGREHEDHRALPSAPQLVFDLGAYFAVVLGETPA